jgi:hypothetical protein
MRSCGYRNPAGAGPATAGRRYQLHAGPACLPGVRSLRIRPAAGAGAENRHNLRGEHMAASEANAAG